MSGWALVTGSAKRIGREIALELARGGYDIIVHYNTSQEEAVQTAKKIHALGRSAALFECDLADLQLVKKIILVLTKEFGTLAALVNNASLFLPDRLDPDNLQKTVNAATPRILSESFYRLNKTGAVINLLDIIPTTPGFSHYNKSKKALANLTQQHALRFAPHMRVNGIALGPVLPSERQSPQHFRRLVKKTPLQKPAAPEDIARAVRFLIENLSMTGNILAVDSGAHLARH